MSEENTGIGFLVPVTQDIESLRKFMTSIEYIKAFSRERYSVVLLDEEAQALRDFLEGHYTTSMARLDALDCGIKLTSVKAIYLNRDCGLERFREYKRKEKAE